MRRRSRGREEEGGAGRRRKNKEKEGRGMEELTRKKGGERMSRKREENGDE